MSDATITSDIERLIIEEQDPQRRAFLVVLNNINSAVLATTKLAQDVSADNQTLRSNLNEHVENFQTHVQAVDAAKNQGRGGWKIAVVACGLIQALVAYIAYDANATLNSFKHHVEVELKEQGQSISALRVSVAGIREKK